MENNDVLGWSMSIMINKLNPSVDCKRLTLALNGRRSLLVFTENSRVHDPGEFGRLLVYVKDMEIHSERDDNKRNDQNSKNPNRYVQSTWAAAKMRREEFRPIKIDFEGASNIWLKDFCPVMNESSHECPSKKSSNSPADQGTSDTSTHDCCEI